MLAEADLETGEVDEWKTIWNGTGGLVRDLHDNAVLPPGLTIVKGP